MKTAVLYSGNARTISHLVGNHRFYLHRHLPNPSLFVSVAADDQAEDAKLLAKALPSAPFFYEKVEQPYFPDREETTLCGYPRESNQLGVFRQLWHLSRVWDFMNENTKAEDFDLFVRVRCDSRFMRVELPDIGWWAPTYSFHPRWSKWGGLNDRFAIMGRQAAELYFGTFKNLENLFAIGAPIHPETLIHTQLTENGIKPQSTLKVGFAPLRLPDENHPRPWTKALDISGVDLLDASSS